MARRKQPEAEAPGDKPVRINMVFQRSIYDYISVACGIEGSPARRRIPKRTVSFCAFLPGPDRGGAGVRGRGGPRSCCGLP